MARWAKIIRFPGRRRAPAPPADERKLVEVRRCPQAEALVVKGLLETEGIPTVLRARQVSSVYPFSIGDQAEVVVLVPEAEAARSRLVLARIAPGPSFP